MRTTVTLDDELLKGAEELTGIKEKSALIRKASAFSTQCFWHLAYSTVSAALETRPTAFGMRKPSRHRITTTALIRQYDPDQRLLIDSHPTLWA